MADLGRGVDHRVVRVDAEGVVGRGVGDRRRGRAEVAARPVRALRADVPDEEPVAVGRRAREGPERRAAPGRSWCTGSAAGRDRAPGAAAARRSSAPPPPWRRWRPGGRRRPCRSARGAPASPAAGRRSCGWRSRPARRGPTSIWIMRQEQRADRSRPDRTGTGSARSRRSRRCGSAGSSSSCRARRGPSA